MPTYDDDDEAMRSYDGSHSRWDDADDGPDERDLVPDDFLTVPCTRCRKLIFEETQRCPYCKHYQLEEERNRRPLWFRLAVIICLCAMAGGLAAEVLRMMHRWF